MAVASWFKMKARHYEVFAAASDEQAGKGIKAALAYLNAGELSQLEGVEAILFGVLKPDIDDSITAYQKRCETNRENGKLGGRPPKGDFNSQRNNAIQMLQDAKDQGRF